MSHVPDVITGYLSVTTVVFSSLNTNPWVDARAQKIKNNCARYGLTARDPFVKVQTFKKLNKRISELLNGSVLGSINRKGQAEAN